jgi:hypothetical protein
MPGPNIEAINRGHTMILPHKPSAKRHGRGDSAIPPSVRPVLRAARRRYRAYRVPQRPALADPVACAVLFPLRDLRTLALAGWWPLPPQALAWLRERPGDRPRRRRRRLAALVRRVLAADLPDALNVLLGRDGR